MATTDTLLYVVNATPYFRARLSVTVTDAADWKGDSRPDFTFNLVSLAVGSGISHPEVLTALSPSLTTGWYAMTVYFDNGDTFQFTNNQNDANNVNERSIYTWGDYVVYQSSGNGINKLSLQYKPATPVLLSASPASGGVPIGILPAGSLTLSTFSNWMQYIPDGTNLCNVTIPGTHDSATKNGCSGVSALIPPDSVWGTIVKVVETINPLAYIVDGIASKLAIDTQVITQTMSIKEQLTAGIRFLDIRARNDNGVFVIRHGEVDILGTTFEWVLDQVSDFLKDHPYEMVLMSLKEEGSGTAASGRFASDFVAGYSVGRPWFRGNDIPTYIDSTTRGRIILINRFSSSFTTFGFPISVVDDGFTNATNTATNIQYHIQDAYNVGAKDSPYTDKVTNITTLANLAANGTGSNQLFLNFTSAVAPLTPEPTRLYTIASTINPQVETLYASYPAGKQLGVSVMDFPPSSLISALINRNTLIYGSSKPAQF